MKRTIMNRFILIASVIFVTILAILATQIYFAEKTLQDSAIKSLDSIHLQAQRSMNSFLYDMEPILYSFGYSAAVQQYVKAEDEEDRRGMNRELETAFQRTALIQRGIQGISLYDRSMNLLASHGGGAEPDHPTVYTPLNASGGIERAPYYSLLFPIFDARENGIVNARIGSARFTLSSDYLQQQIISSYALYDDCTMFLMDGGGVILAASHSRAASFRDMARDGEPGDGRYIVKRTLLSRNHWELVSVMPRGVIASDMTVINRASILVGGLILIALLFYVAFLYRNMVAPIRVVSGFMKNVADSAEDGGLAAVRPLRLEDRRYAEFGIMVGAMNGMLASLEQQKESLLQKEKEYYAAVLEANRMELLAYRNQINPHFLYNTLDCIRGIALYRNAPEITEISQSLSSMFHYVVKGDNFVTVEDEIGHVREYARIIGYRFQERITVDCRVEAGVGGCRILKLMIQPMVENAALHGLEERGGNGTITVSAKRREDMLEISVADDGVGMPPEKVAALTRDLDRIKNTESGLPPTEAGIGLSNIARRLRLFYGSRFFIAIESSPGSGMRVLIRIPVETEEEASDEV